MGAYLQHLFIRTPLTIALVLAALGLGAAAATLHASADVQEPDRVTLCHNGRSLTLSLNAEADHLAHGDTPGPCSPGGLAATGFGGLADSDGSDVPAWAWAALAAGVTSAALVAGRGALRRR